MHFVIVWACSEPLVGRLGSSFPTHYEICWSIFVPSFLYHGLTDVLLLLLFILPACLWPFSFIMQGRSQLRTLISGVEKFKNISKRYGWKSPTKGRLDMKPWGFACSKRAVRNLYLPSKIQNNAKGNFHSRAAKKHAAVLDTGSHQSMIVMVDWEIIKRHNSWINSQGVNMGEPSKSGIFLRLVGARGVVKIVWVDSAN